MKVFLYYYGFGTVWVKAQRGCCSTEYRNHRNTAGNGNMHRPAIVRDKQITCADRRGQILESSFAAQVCDVGSTQRLDLCDCLVILGTAEKNNFAIYTLLQFSD